MGMAPSNQRLIKLVSLLQTQVVPFFIGKDACQIESLVDAIYTYKSNYKYAGMPLWNCVAVVELAILDLLAKAKAVPVGGLFGAAIRTEYPIYLSTFDRKNSAEHYLDQCQKQLLQTSISAIKLKIGGRMSNNRDCVPGRTEKMIPLFRKELAEDTTIYVDANGSYNAEEAIRIGKMLQAYNYGFFEEPCPWQDYESTIKVSENLTIPVAGGEQDSSLYQFKYMLREGGFKIVQPDMMYNGGFIRTLRIAQLAERNNIPITLHSPQKGALNALQQQFCSIVPNIGRHQEFQSGNDLQWCRIEQRIDKGKLSITSKTGWGIDYDDSQIKKAKIW